MQEAHQALHKTLAEMKICVCNMALEQGRLCWDPDVRNLVLKVLKGLEHHDKLCVSR